MDASLFQDPAFTASSPRYNEFDNLVFSPSMAFCLPTPGASPLKDDRDSDLSTSPNQRAAQPAALHQPAAQLAAFTQPAAQPAAPKKVDPRVKPVVNYPNPLPKGRRAKTAEEKQQRADERIQRNRKAAARSREKHTQIFENMKLQLEEKDQEIAQLKQALEQARAQASMQFSAQQRAPDMPNFDTAVPPPAPANPEFDYNFGETIDNLLVDYTTSLINPDPTSEPLPTTVNLGQLELR